MSKRVLFISNLYPNRFFPNMASYNRQQIAELRKLCDVEVISPIPWTEFLKGNLNPLITNSTDVDAHFPSYYYTPRILRKWYGDFFYVSIKNVASRVLERKQFDFVFSSWLYPDSWAAAKLARKYNVPFFVKVHGTDVNRLEAGTALTARSLEVTRQAEKVICVSKALKERLNELGVPENKLEVLYNGVDRAIFFARDKELVRRELNIDPNEFIVLYVGNLKKDKGLGEVITAFKTVYAATVRSRLIIIGSGAFKQEIEQLITSLNLSEKVQLLGSMPLETIATWMNAASVLCLPSYMEGVPNVVLEALSCGTPVVATRVGGIPELDNGDGMVTLVTPRESSELAAALLSISRNPRATSATSTIASWQQNAQQLYSILTGN